MEERGKQSIVLYCKNLVAFKHACKVMENFNPLDFPPSKGVQVSVRVADKEVNYNFPTDKFSFLKEQVRLLDKVRVNIKQNET